MDWYDSNNLGSGHTLHPFTSQNQNSPKGTNQDLIYNKEPLASSGSSTVGKTYNKEILDKLVPQQLTSLVSQGRPEIIPPDPVLNFRALKQTWLTVKVNSTILFSGLLSSQDSKSFSLKIPLRLIISELENIEISVNDELINNLGKKEIIVISTENYRQFITTVD